jgi:hypothetical protein
MEFRSFPDDGKVYMKVLGVKVEGLFSTYFTLSSTCTLGCRGEVGTAVKGLVGRLHDGQAIVLRCLCHAFNPAPAWFIFN